MTRAQYHPEHDRTSCSDESPINADPACSAGCARCTALLLDQRTEAVRLLRLAHTALLRHSLQHPRQCLLAEVQDARAALAAISPFLDAHEV